MSLAAFAFQACSFNHSDISPFDSLRSLTAGRVRINELQATTADYRRIASEFLMCRDHFRRSHGAALTDRAVHGLLV